MLRKIMSIFVLIASAFSFHLYFFQTNYPLVSIGTDATNQLLLFRTMLENEYKSVNFFWSWSYGLGGDLFAQFNYYYSNSIFFILSIFFDSTTIQQMVESNFAVAVMKTSIAVILMFVLLRYERRGYGASLLGAISYGGAVTFAKYMQTFDFMTDAFVLLPLIVLALQYFLDTSKRTPFILAWSLMLVTNFYFAFIMTIFLVIFATYKYFERERYSIGDFFTYVVQIAWMYIVAIGLSAFAFFPAIYQFFNSDRLEKEYHIPLMFSKTFYYDAPRKFFLSYFNGYSVGVALIIGIILCCGLFIPNRKLLPKKLFVVAMIIFTCVPYMYSVFNGFSAMQTRWLFLVAFSISYVVGSFIDEASTYKKFPFIATVIYCIFTIYSFWRWYERPLHTVQFDQSILLVTLIGLVSLFMLTKFKRWRTIGYSLLIISVIWNAQILYSSYYTKAYSEIEHIEDFANFFDKAGYGNLEGQHVSNGIKRAETDFGRVIWDSPQIEMNSGMLYGLKTHSAYQSLIPRNVHQLFKEQYNIKQLGTSSLYHNYDNRLYLETAFANEFYITEMKTWYTPYGYQEIFATPNWRVMQNEYALPLGYAYPASAWMDEDTFKSLTLVERDQALLSTVTVKDEMLMQQPSTFNRETLQTELLVGGVENVRFINIKKLGENVYAAAEEEAYMEIDYDRPATAGEILVEVDIETIEDREFSVKVSDKVMTQYAPSHIWAYPKSTLTFNLGTIYKQTPLKIALTESTYKIDDVRVYFNSYEPYKELVKERKAQSLENIEYKGGHVAGNVTLQEDSLFFLSIPYSVGWSLKVDGQKQPIYEVNQAFIGFPLAEGQHRIELSYVTPWLKGSLAVTILTLFGIIFSLWRNRK